MTIHSVLYVAYVSTYIAIMCTVNNVDNANYQRVFILNQHM